MDNKANAQRVVFINLLVGFPTERRTMSFTFDEFPEADYYRSDLRKILKYVREINEYIKNYDEVIAELQQQLANIQGLYTRVDNLENAIKDLDSIRSDVSRLMSDVNRLKNTDDVLQSEINDLRSSLQDIDRRFREVYNYVDISIAAVNARWYKKWLQLQSIMNTQYTYLLYLIDELEDKFNDVISKLAHDVYNPIAHERLTFDNNNRMVYTDLRDDGMSYGELSARRFTYEFIRDAKWTHRIFSTKGRRYVTHSDVNLYSPVSGRYTNWSEALSNAIGFIFGTITYNELAEQQVTYAQMESLTYADLIRLSNREPLDYEALSDLTINGTNILAF